VKRQWALNTTFKTQESILPAKQNKSIIHKFGLTKLGNFNIKALFGAAGGCFLPCRKAKVDFFKIFKVFLNGL